MVDQPAQRTPMPLEDRIDEQQPITHVRVVNRNPFTIEDRYNSEIFTFEPNKRVTVPRFVAQHIFGLGMQPQEQLFYCMRRFGWNIPSMAENQFSQAKMYFNNISITPVMMRLVEIEPDTDPRPTRAPGPPASRSRYKPPTDIVSDESEDKPE